MPSTQSRTIRIPLLFYLETSIQGFARVLLIPRALVAAAKLVAK